MIKVTLRQKPISGGRNSLYLDYYPAIIGPDGEPTRREFLKLYTFATPGGPVEKQHNKETLRLAEQIKLRRLGEVNKPEVYSAHERDIIKKREQGDKCFYTYFSKQREKRSGQVYAAWGCTLNHLKAYAGDTLKIKDITVKFCEGFKDYLLKFATDGRTDGVKAIANNSAAVYYNFFKAALKQAHKEDMLPNDIGGKVAPIAMKETRREFLTLDELNKLAATPCRNESLKRAALFAALTGLRISDIKKMIWREVTPDGLLYTQQKTGKVETLPISNQARELMGEPSGPASLVFPDVNNTAHENAAIAQWVADAGISKKITFHNFRHSFATLQLAAGTDIFTVSKLLGHRNLNTTQVYAKVLDKAKREAMERIKLEL